MQRLELTIPLVVGLAAGGCATQRPSCPSPAVAAKKDRPPEAARYGKVFYGSTEHTSPNAILRLDNNEAIVEACAGDGETEAKLRERGLRLNASQIQLLLHYGLLSKEGAILRTTFPVLDRRKTAALRRAMRANASAALGSLRDEIEALGRALASGGRAGGLYTILFSYVLDGIVWERFEQLGHPTKVDAPKEAIWSGVLWMLAPPRPYRCGTNSITEGGVTFRLHWSDVARAQLRPFLSNWRLTAKLASELIKKGRVDDAEVRAAFGRYGVFDAAGRMLLPVIEERADNATFAAADKIAARVSAGFIQRVDLGQIARDLGTDQRRALVIAYHEWMWELLGLLEQRGIVERPAAFADPQKAAPQSAGQLMFLVKGSARHAAE